MSYADEYIEVQKKEYAKRLINVQEEIYFRRKKITKLRKKYTQTKDKIKIMFMVLSADNFRSFILFYKYFSIDKRLTIENTIKELYKYRGDNIYFKSNYLGIPIMKYYKNLGKSRYTTDNNNLLDVVLHTSLLKRNED